MLPKRQVTTVSGNNFESSASLGVDVPSPSVCVSKIKDRQDFKSAVNDLEYFSKSSNLKGVKEDLLMKKKVDKFKQKFESILSTVDCEKLDENDLFLCVMQSSEDYFHMSNKEDCDKLKFSVCVDILKKFTDGNEKICMQLLRALQKNVKKSTFYRRNKKYLLKGFFSLVKALSGIN